MVLSNSNTIWFFVYEIDTTFSASPERILLISIRVFPGTTSFLSATLFFSGTLRMEILCPSSETTFRILSLISNNSPVISLLLSLSEIEKIV